MCETRALAEEMIAKCTAKLAEYDQLDARLKLLIAELQKNIGIARGVLRELDRAEAETSNSDA